MHSNSPKSFWPILAYFLVFRHVLTNLKNALESQNIETEKFTYFDYVAEESSLIDANKKYFAEMLQDFESASEITSDAKNAAEKVNVCDAPLNLISFADTESAATCFWQEVG